MNNPSPPHAARTTYPPPEPAAPVYPIARPAGGDARFTVGLTLDVAAVLARHGYPSLAGGADLAHWQHILFTGLYTTHGTEITA